MDAVAGSAGTVPFDERELRRGAASVRHPLAQALLVLTFTTGLVDAVSFLGLGQVFAANMTGNIVFLGFGIAGSHDLPVVAPLVSLASFVLGTGVGGELVKRVAYHPALVGRALLIEAALLGVAAVFAAVVTVTVGDLSGYFVIALLAFAMGVRTTVVRRLAVRDLLTTVVTFTLTGLTSESPLAGGSGEGSVRRGAAVLAVLAGAVSGALLLKTDISIPIALASLLALLTAGLYGPAVIRLAGATGAGAPPG